MIDYLMNNNRFRCRPKCRPRCRFAGLLLFTLLASCTTVGPDYKKPDRASPEAWVGQLEGGLTQQQLDPETLSQWWKSLGDPVLGGFVERAIAANLDLRTAEAQLCQARAQRGIIGSTRFPTIDAEGFAIRTGSSENTGAGSTSELYSSSFDAAWELDIFGGRHRALEAAEADFQAAQEARRDVLVSVLAEVAVNYIELRTFQAQYAVAKQNLLVQLDTLEIVQAQFDAGAVLELDLERAVSNAETTRSELPRLNQAITQAKNRLAVLIGQTPGTVDKELDGLRLMSTPSVQIAVGVPAETLRRRPDVRRAERQLAAETARIGVATAVLYPKFTLAGTIGLESLSPSNLIASDSRTWGIGPSVQWNIFDGGRTRQKIAVQNALQEQAMVQYEASILNALEEVENAITAFTQEQLRYRSLVESAAAAERAANIAQTRYEAGASNFLTVLDTQRTLLSTQNRQAASQGAIMSNLVRLYKSLGGGWTPEQPINGKTE